jgi:glycosyltransferase involved in cell wall biosynthesis
MKMSISVVIPTYNRPDQLSSVLDKLFESNVDEFESVEVIVVDDGSPQPAEPVVKSKNVQYPFSLTYLSQDNCGPAKARNTGFRAASHEIVLFLDDDVLADRDLMRQHILGHQEIPKSVIFGIYPLAPIYEGMPAKRYLDSLQAPFESSEGLERKFTVASGHLSVEKSVFNDRVYDEQLSIPGAEEFELAYRLNTSGIPIYQNNSAVGWHLQSPDIENKCRQEFKYGISVGETYLKMPNSTLNQHFDNFIRVNGYIDWKNDSSKLKVSKALKSIASSKLFRSMLLRSTRVLEASGSSERILFFMYRVLSGLSLFAGVRRGLRNFNN